VTPERTEVPRWRIAAAVVIFAGLLFFLAIFTPIYLRNMKLQNFVSDTAHRVENQTVSDEAVRSMVLQKAQELRLPVTDDNVHIIRSPGGMHIDVRYFVPVSFPGYTVRLHFYPGAGSR
jgi:hypothetical protein